jgi:EAL domain-containing protein (putative c-di-GMP-specific phosphodiesterase class I)
MVGRRNLRSRFSGQQAGGVGQRTDDGTLPGPFHEVLEDLKALGVRLAIDDFGTGYSSLTYLKRFPVDELKVDQAFVAGLLSDPEDAAIVAAVINLAHTLGLAAVAEGVENAAQVAQLCRLGCDIGQGYHFGRPVPADAFAERLGLLVP